MSGSLMRIRDGRQVGVRALLGWLLVVGLVFGVLGGVVAEGTSVSPDGIQVTDMSLPEPDGLCNSAGTVQFSDVDADDYAAEYILCMRALGLSSGIGHGAYGPELSLTRAQMATFLVRLWKDLGKTCPASGGVPFTDIDPNSVHYSNIVCIYGLEITVGTTATTYSPSAALSYRQIFIFLSRLYEAYGNSCPAKADVTEEATECLVDLNVIPVLGPVGFDIADSVTRADMAVYLIGLWYNLTGKGLPPAPPSPITTEPVTTEPLPGDPGTPIVERFPERLQAAKAAISSLPEEWSVDSCPVPVNASSDDYVIVLRLDGGCVVADKHDLRGRTLKQARDKYSRDLSVLAVDYPVEVTLHQPDPDIGKQWHLEPQHLDANPHLIANSLNAGWPVGASVTVAVIDSGVDTTHADLAGSFVTGSGHCDNGQHDRHSHGTHVAGIVTETLNNGIGGAGVAPEAWVMPIAIQLPGVPQDGTELNTTEAIACATNHDMDIINMSFGGAYDSTAVKTAIQLADSKGIVLVASAGNCGDSNNDIDGFCTVVDMVMYPAAYAEVIAVAATDDTYNQAVFSNANHTVDIAAPGVKIWSTIPQNHMNPYSGTSMAAPAVSAVVAHMIARCPNESPDGIKKALYSTAFQPFGSPGRNDEVGWGIVRPADAIVYLKSNGLCVTVPTPPTSCTTKPGKATITKLTSNYPGSGNLTVEWSEPSGGDCDVTAYRVHYKPSDSSEPSRWVPVHPPTRTKTIVHLTPGKEYCVTVGFFTNLGRSPSSNPECESTSGHASGQGRITAINEPDSKVVVDDPNHGPILMEYTTNDQFTVDTNGATMATFEANLTVGDTLGYVTTGPAGSNVNWFYLTNQ